MKRVQKPENMATFKNNQRGFGVIEMLMLLIIIILIAAAGWLVLKNHSKTTASKKVTKTLQQNITAKNPAGPGPSQYVGWQSFCSSYGGLCLKYPTTWKLNQASSAPGANANGQEVDTITSPSGNVTVTYRPSAQVSGDRRQEAIKVFGVTATDLSSLVVVKLIDYVGGTSNSYAVEDYVTLATAAHALNNADTPFTTGATIASTSEPPYHQFTNPLRPGDIGQQLLAVTVSNGDPGSNFFNSNSAAQSWLNSPEVVTAGQIIDSVTYAQ
jgi:Tfp pilus assembly protein PilV